MTYFDEYDYDEEPKGKRCKHCGAGPFTWHDTGMRWVLLDDDAKVHRCAPVATADDFDDVTEKD